jgi:CheY-like chemotaxis protein
MGQQSRPDLSLVLIVDDDEDVLQVMADVLETLGYRVLTARTAREAVEELRRNSQVSVLLTDIRMPDVAGEGLAGIAATWRPDIRVVFTSGFGKPRGDSEFLRKPFRAPDPHPGLSAATALIGEIMSAATDPNGGSSPVYPPTCDLDGLIQKALIIPAD